MYLCIYESMYLGVCGADARAELCIYAHPPPENRNLLILNSGLNKYILKLILNSGLNKYIFKLILN